MPHGASPAEPIKKIKQGPLGVDLTNLVSLGQRQLALPGRRQFGPLNGGVTISPPRDISRQVQ